MDDFDHNPFCEVVYKDGQYEEKEEVCFSWVKERLDTIKEITYRCKDLTSTALKTDKYTREFLDNYNKSKFSTHYKDVLEIVIDNTFRPALYYQTIDIKINVTLVKTHTEFLTLCNIFRIFQECPDQPLAILRLEREYPDNGFLTNFYLSQCLYDKKYPKKLFTEAIPNINPYYQRLEGHGISNPFYQIACNKLDEDLFVKNIKTEIGYGGCHKSILKTILNSPTVEMFNLRTKEYYLPITKENVEKVQKCL